MFTLGRVLLPRRYCMPAMQRSLDSFFGANAKRKASSTNENTKKKLNTPQPVAGAVAVKASPEVKPETKPEVKPEARAQEIEDKDDSLKYLTVAETFEKIEATTKRLEITKFCADLFIHVLKKDPAILPAVAYLCINRLGPDYEGLELGIGESLIIKALAESTGKTPADVKKQYVKLGDLGTVALNAKKSQTTMFKPKPLYVSKVFEDLKKIAKSTGSQSQARKISIIKQILVSCRGTEAKYLVRSLEGKLRIGLAEKTVQTALGQAFAAYDKIVHREINVSPEKADDLIKDAFSQVPNYDIVIDACLKDGIAKLADNVKITPGVPLKPMLAKPTKSVSEVLDRFSGETFTCEYKYDGERAQVHCTEAGTMHVYSRNMEDMTQRYPDIIDVIPKIKKSDDLTKSFILDCEAVAWDREQKKILPFQVLSTRKRKDVESGNITVRVHLFVFDVLYLNGESLLQKPFDERRKFIESHFAVLPGEFTPATHMNSESLEDIQTFLEDSVQHSCEGLMIKILSGGDSFYEPSKRSVNWLKLKKDYLEGIGDSLDLVVLGAYYGRGKRTSVYGGFLLGCYNPNTEEYETVCKIGTGFTEADLDRIYKELSPLASTEKKSYISHDQAANQQPNVWFEPKLVWEVLTADLSLSPVYQAGSEEMGGKGVSLRFPRFIREREDKGPEDSTSSEQLVELYRRQVSVQEGPNNMD